MLSHYQVLQRVWGYDTNAEERVADVHVSHFSQELGDGRFVAGTRGVGYRLKDAAVRA